MPSMSWPRCVCTSKMSAPAGTSARSSSLQRSTSCSARATASTGPESSYGASRARRADLRRQLPLAGVAARGPARRARPVPLRGARRHAPRRRLVARGRKARGGRRLRGAPVRGVRVRRAARAGARAARGGARRRPACARDARGEAGDGAAHLPGLARGRAARARRRARRRRRALRRPPARQDGGAARGDAAGTARRRSRHGRRTRPAAPRDAERRRARGRRRAAHGRAPQIRDRGRLRRERGGLRRLHRRARRAGRHGPRDGLGTDRGRGADRVRRVAARRAVVRLLRHDAHVRRRRGARGRAALARALPGGARADARGSGARRQRPRDLRRRVRRLRGGRRADAAHQGAGRAARRRLLPRPRPRGRARVEGRAAAGRRRHPGAGRLSPRVRRRAAGGPRARHGGRTREPHDVPVRPRAVGCGAQRSFRLPATSVSVLAPRLDAGEKGGSMAAVVEPATTRTIVEPVPVADPAPLGLAGFALTTFLLSGHNASFIPDLIWVGPALFYGGLAQFLAGMWEFRNRNVFGATAFSTYGGFWMGLGIFVILAGTTKFTAGFHGGDLTNALAWYLFAFAVFNTYMLLNSLRVSAAVFLVFLTLEITEIVLVIGFFVLSHNGHTWWLHAGGWCGVVTAAVAWYASAAGVANNMAPQRIVLPVGAPLWPAAPQSPMPRRRDV